MTARIRFPKNSYFGVFLASIIGGLAASSANAVGTLVYSFIAPLVPSTASVPTETGLIVFDEGANLFKGYGATGGWQSLSAGLSPPVNAPIGTVAIWPLATFPADPNWMLIENITYSKTTYPELFEVYGTTFNVGGETSDQFRLPPVAGRTVIGAGTGSGLTARTVGQKIGEESHVLTIPEMPNHAHGGGSHYHGTGGPAVRTDEPAYAVRFPNGGTAVGGSKQVPGASSNSYSTAQYPNTLGPNTTVVAAEGGNGAHNVMQPSLVVNFIVRYR